MERGGRPNLKQGGLAEKKEVPLVINRGGTIKKKPQNYNRRNAPGETCSTPLGMEASTRVGRKKKKADVVPKRKRGLLSSIKTVPGPCPKRTKITWDKKERWGKESESPRDLPTVENWPEKELLPRRVKKM